MSIRLTNCSIFSQGALRHDFALQIKAGRIEAVGPMAESQNWPRPEREISLEGRIVLPGLMDAHMHLENWALRHSQLSLEGVKSLPELLALVREQVQQKEAAGDKSTLLLAGWNEELYPERRPPSRRELDEISAELPIILTRICGHVSVVNSAVLKEFDWQKYIDSDPGSVGLDLAGKPNGILSENAMTALLSRQEAPSAEKRRELLLFGLKSMAAYGLTAVASQETNSLRDLAFLDLLAEIYEADDSLPAYYAQIGLTHPAEIPDFLALQKIYAQHPRIRIASVKLFKDGSLGGRTALLRDPYSDDPTNCGLDLIPYKDLLQWFESAKAAGVQLAIHAIGDRAIDEIISAFTESCSSEEERKNPLRHTIIHCQITDADLLQRLHASKLLVITQPLFAPSDWPMAAARLGSARRNQAYDYRSVLDLGIHQAFSSDSPVESANPLLTLAAAIDHPQPEKSLTFSEAVAASSSKAAYILGEEARRGSIRAGAAADLTVLQTGSDLTAKNLRTTAIALTMRDGKIIYQNT